MNKYKVVRYGQWWYGILNTETDILLRVGPNPNYNDPLDNKENKLLLFKSKEKAQEYIDNNLNQITSSQGQILKRGDLNKYKISDKELEEVRRREIDSLIEKSDVLKPIPESFAIIELSTFKKDWKRLGLNDSDLKDLKKRLKEVPPETHIGNGVYKFRFSPKNWNSGARDAGRGYYIEVIADTKAYLVTAYRKNEKGNLTPEETKNIRELAKLLRSK